MDDILKDEILNALVASSDPELPTVKGRPKIPDGLVDTLLAQLKPNVRVELARSLIDIAVNGTKESDRLTAIKEIYDRVEGKSRQRVETKTAADDPLLKALNEMYEDYKLGSGSSGPFIDVIDGESREI